MKRIKLGKWSFEQSDASFGYHLYKDVEVINKDTKKSRIESKIQGYDMSLRSIIRIISEDESFEESTSIKQLIDNIENKLNIISENIKQQLKN